MRGVRLILGALVVAALALPPGAGAVTFGADLEQRTPNSTATCGYPPYYPGFYPWGDSCTFFSSSTPTGQASETHVVPLPDPAVHGNQRGTITEVRIKTGPYQAGPAKLTVLRAHRAFNGGEAACCVGQAESAQFTLTPNSIVHVTTDLPVESRYDAAQRIYTYDTLALSVLDATTPIPGEFSGDPNGYCSRGYFPYVQTGQERLSGDYGICGFLVLMQADMTIHGATGVDGGGETGDGESGGGGDASTVTFPAARGRIAAGTAHVPLRCAGETTCAGVLRLQSTGMRQSTSASTSKAKRVVTYAKRRFEIDPGSRATVKARLSKRGRKLIRGRKRVTVYANVTLAGETATFSKKVALKVR